ncbi:hypothetical protein BCR37DRAFT_383955 [Protomyces lactucae-debilis]|uniref:Uncharacterized protein n=1 Tax=Protomyces lactucae-debilis TaxID=2754530 RepID=A0A1Y2EXE7_PROLT|nr:uncharacterized protein BCR37DRAFT_383955 [Protomyces lactucae-debilis]ORY75796.1 hypothetical protein BCR37DRAFT_383955 [Protomyces lactucae-debilis]
MQRASIMRSSVLKNLQAATSRSQMRLQSTMASDPQANIGDYPTNIPAINRQTRSETVKWDNQQDRRNFNEPLHELDDVLTVFGPDVHTHVKPRTAFFHLGVWLACFMGVVGFGKIMFFELPAERRTYPYNGLEKELAGNKARTE